MKRRSRGRETGKPPRPRRREPAAPTTRAVEETSHVHFNAYARGPPVWARYSRDALSGRVRPDEPQRRGR